MYNICIFSDGSFKQTKVIYMTKHCLNCDNFRFFVKEDERIVWCDLMFEYYTVSMEEFTEAFYVGKACEHWIELDELTEQEME